MDTSEDHELLRIQNEKLQHEVDDLKTMLSIVKENFDLRSKLDSLSLNGSATENAGSLQCDKSRSSGTLSCQTENIGKKMRIQWRDSVDESQFRSGLLKKPHRTSSPLSLSSDIDSPNRPPFPVGELPGFSSSYQKVEDPERLVGEIAFQLDRRILSYIFRDQPRLYGFTVLNIGDKIVQVSTHPVTGMVEEAYRLELAKRYTELMDQLCSLGYNRTLHPPFAEFIINTYGILKQRPHPTTASELNSPAFLRRVLVETVTPSLLKDLLLLFSCLCYLARRDGKPLFLW